MATLSYRGKVDLGVAAGVILIGLFFLWQALIISMGLADDVVGPRAVPIFLAATLIALGVLIGIFALFERKRAGADAPQALPEGETAASLEAKQAAEEDFGFLDSDLKRVFAVIGLGFVYIALFYALGYLLATFISLALMLFVFGNRNILVVLAASLAGALIYQYVFMGLMGLYDPPGQLFDLNAALQASGLFK